MQLYRESFNTIVTQISRIYRNRDALGQKTVLCSVTTQNHGDSSRCVMEETTFLHNYLHQPFFDICCHSLHTNTNFLFNVYIVHRICSV